MIYVPVPRSILSRTDGTISVKVVHPNHDQQISIAINASTKQKLSTTDIRSGASVRPRSLVMSNKPISSLIDVSALLWSSPFGAVEGTEVLAVRSRCVNWNWLRWLDAWQSYKPTPTSTSYILSRYCWLPVHSAIIFELSPLRRRRSGADKLPRSTGGQYIEHDVDSSSIHQLASVSVEAD